MATLIKSRDFVHSLTEALQLISYAHPADFVRHLVAAWRREESPEAREAMEQILVNSRMAMLGHRPVCQDTGIVNVFLKVGLGVRWEAEDIDIQALVDQAVRRAFLDEANPLRASIVADPLFSRRNTGDNTPAVVEVELVAGDRLQVKVAAKGGGSENKAQFAVLLPGADVAAWVVDRVADLGAGWCPPGILGIGVGGTAEKAMLLAKQALMQPLDMDELSTRPPETETEKLRLDIWRRVNALGIGAQGLGGQTTALDVKLLSHPTHAASMPVALIPNCAATRHVAFELDGSGPAVFVPPVPSVWPEIVRDRTAAAGRPVDLGGLDAAEVGRWRAGDRLLLSGRLLTARDAAHRRLSEMMAQGRPLPVPLAGRVIYYVGPVEAVGDEVVGPAGPTTATRMDGFMDEMLGAGVLATIGKAERGPDAIAAIARHRRASLIAVGGAAFLIAKSVRAARTVAFEDLGMEAIREFEVVDMPVTVAVDSEGRSIHQEGPARWRRDPV